MTATTKRRRATAQRISKGISVSVPRSATQMKSMMVTAVISKSAGDFRLKNGRVCFGFCMKTFFLSLGPSDRPRAYTIVSADGAQWFKCIHNYYNTNKTANQRECERFSEKSLSKIRQKPKPLLHPAKNGI